MKLQHIEIDNLKLSPLNVRKHGTKDGSDLVPSIRSLGVLQPLLVRPNCEGYEVVAGQRRLDACRTLAGEGDIGPIPCAVMEEGDDAAAIEASLAENIARLPMDEIDQFEAFAALIKQGQSVEDVADHFGVTERLVTQRLAIANLYAPILNACRRGEIGPRTMRILTMASTRQQRAWFKLFKSEDENAPEGHRLKSWLFGGEEIPLSNALFDPDTYKGVIATDLFGEEGYFADPSLFWEYQSTAIAALIEDLKDEGWADVILHDVGGHWSKWEHVKTAMEDGGAVHIACRGDGEVEVHKGYITEKEAGRRARAKTKDEDGDEAPARPEITKAMQNYLALHRHAAVRAELLAHPGIAIRLAVAQIIAGSELWDIAADPQKAATDAIKDSLAKNSAEDLFRDERLVVRDLLNLDCADDGTIVPARGDWQAERDPAAIFARLLDHDDQTISRILAFVVAETLASGSVMVDVLGTLMNVDMAGHWAPDETFFDLMRDKQAINAMLNEIGGKAVADGNLTETAKVQKQIIRDFVNGGNGREARPGWRPRYTAFPMNAYTERGGIEAIDRWNKVSDLFKDAA